MKRLTKQKVNEFNWIMIVLAALYVAVNFVLSFVLRDGGIIDVDTQMFFMYASSVFLVLMWIVWGIFWLVYRVQKSFYDDAPLLSAFLIAESRYEERLVSVKSLSHTYVLSDDEKLEEFSARVFLEKLKNADDDPIKKQIIKIAKDLRNNANAANDYKDAVDVALSLFPIKDSTKGMSKRKRNKVRQHANEHLHKMKQIGYVPKMTVMMLTMVQKSGKKTAEKVQVISTDLVEEVFELDFTVRI